MLGTHDSRRAAIALCLMALLGVALVLLYPGTPEQDTAYHFLMARGAWGNPWFFVGVWARPLYTAVYAAPALAGFATGRLFSVAIGVATAWQTWRLARDLKLERAWLVIPLLLGQPVFFELLPDMLTELLFGFLFVVALRWHLRGWTKRGMAVAALLPLARPEGVFLCLLWGMWVIFGEAKSSGDARPLFRRAVRTVPQTLVLASGVAIWWLAALCITGDPLHILHNWPRDWHRNTYGRGTIFSYAARAWEFTGVLLAAPFMAGFLRTAGKRQWMPVTSAFLLLFALHTIFRACGLFGEGGYPRYMVSIAPAIAVITLHGWNSLAEWFARRSPNAATALGWGVMMISLAQSFLYLDSFAWARDVVAIKEMSAWLRDSKQPYGTLVWSNAMMCVVSGLDLNQSPSPPRNREQLIAMLRGAPAGTLVFWDDFFGPELFGMTATEIEQTGCRVLRTKHYSLSGFAGCDAFGRKTANRELELSLLMKF